MLRCLGAFGGSSYKQTYTRRQIWPYALRMAWQKYDLELVRNLFPKLSISSNRDIEMVDGFLSRNFSTGLLGRRL